ncbi:mucoidy inhibitor MuiA family protein [Jannaschia sp. LMIT008]|uniref:mucoidy inhibitor MuiA family protein n=1 Tax=Jannaschia maritima TaxID=3032585 RepID=UPI00281218A3|nr:mucoidy inhibitor MuiA family protein [Jannaschia sp. LMIT008]
MRTLIPLILLSLPGIARAADIPLRADIGAATIYQSGAALTRTARAEVEAGTHRLLIPLPGGSRMPEVTLDGAVLTGLSLIPEAGLDLQTLDTPAQARARAALDEATDAVQAAREDLARARAGLRDATTRLDWIDTLTGGGEGALPPPVDGAAIASLLGTLGDAAGAAAADRVTAQARVDAAQRTLEDAQEARDDAQAALDRLTPLPDDTAILSVAIDAPAPGPVDVTVERFDYGTRWAPLYTLALDTMAGTVSLERRAAIMGERDEAWTDVAVTLTTADPSDATAPDLPPPDVVRAGPEVVFGVQAEAMALDGDGAVDRRAASAPAAAPRITGLTVSYDVPEPVTLPPGTIGQVRLGTLDLPAALSLLAVPRTDDRAYLVADLTNPTPEPILEGQAVLMRDGARLGETMLPRIPAGASREVGLGFLDTVQLTWTRLERGEGETGVFRRADTLRERVAFTVANTGDTARDVRVLYALPVSEQEDVTVDVTASPAPDARQWRDRRGVAVWDMTLAPDAERRVELTFEIDWPDDQSLFWEP